MINKGVLQSVINKYHLGVNEDVKWNIKDKKIDVDFMTPTRDVIGKVTSTNFDLEDSKLAIFDTKKLLNLTSICNGDLLLELVKNKEIFTKLKISDLNFNLDYALSDPLLISKVGTVNMPEWCVEIDLEGDDIDHLIKAKSALSGIDNMLVSVVKNIDGESVVEFTFGDEQGHNNKITYQTINKGTILDSALNLKLPYNSDIFKTILSANKDMENGKLYLSSMGLMKLSFNTDYLNNNEVSYISSDYFIIRREETNF
jgi:hypothetical protein